MAHRMTEIVSNRLNTKVKLDRVNVNIFHGLELDGFLIEDLQKDTLIYAGKLHSDFYNSLYGFMYRDFKFNNLNISDGLIRIKRTKDDPLNTLSQLFNPDYDPYKIHAPTALDTSSSKLEKSPLNIELSALKLNNIRYENLDDLAGMDQIMDISRLEASMDTFDIHTLHIHFNSLYIQDSYYNILRRQADTLARPVPEQPEQPSTDQAFKFTAKKLELDNLKFELKDERYASQRYERKYFDSNWMKIHSIQLKAEDVVFSDPYIAEASIDKFAAQSGDFEIVDLKAKRLYVGKRKSGLDDFELFTKRSILRKKLSFSYRSMTDWLYFVDKVLMNGDMRNSRVGFKDLLYFAPDLRDNDYFREKNTEFIQISSKFSGRVNSLNARNIDAQVANSLKFKGAFIGRDLTKPSESLLNIGVKYLETDIHTLNKLIPGFTVPQNFYKLNRINFKGRFDGYYQDFVAYGDLSTDLGTADVDMRLNLKDGSQKAKYSGKLNLYDFDLATWTDHPDFKKISLSANVQNGRGLELKTAYADIGGEIISMDYKNYNYKGIIDAKLEKNRFDGALKIDEPNIGLDFLGNIDFKGEDPIYDFKATVSRLNLKALNINDTIVDARGIIDIKLKGSNVDNIVGSAIGNNLQIKTDIDSLFFEHLALASTLDDDNKRSIYVNSEKGKASIVGFFKLTELPDAAIGLIKKNYPKLTQNVQYISGVPDGEIRADFEADITDISHELSFFLKDKVVLKDFKTSGRIDFKANDLNFKLNTPDISYGDYRLVNLKGSYSIQQDLLPQDDYNGYLKLLADSTMIAGIPMNNLAIQSYMKQDTMEYKITGKQILDSISNLRVDGIFFPNEDKFELAFDVLNFNVLNDQWRLRKNNRNVIGKDYIELSNFELTDNIRALKLQSINSNKGLKANIKDVQLGIVNRWLALDDLELNGKVNAVVSFQDIFNLTGLDLNSDISNLRINSDYIGDLKLNAVSNLSTKETEFTGYLNDYGNTVSVDGVYNYGTKYLDSKLDVKGFPLDFLELFLEGNIENTKGNIYGNIDLSGPISDLNTTGSGEIRNGYTEINYIGTKYFFEDARFVVRKNEVDFTGAKLVDSRGQKADVWGSLQHENFGNLGVDVRIQSDQFILLNTDASSNSVYYGFGQGKADVRIKGPFTDIKMDIKAKTGVESELTLAVQSFNTARDESFLPIIKREDFVAQINQDLDTDVKTKYVGLTLDMFLEVTNDTKMNLIFDPVTGHRLNGKGAGDIQLNLSPDGELKLIGFYNVEAGDYTFAMETPMINILNISKSFKIRNGGQILWSGDPLNATIDIWADYKTIREKLDLFLAEYITGTENSYAKEETDVRLSVNLVDKLLNPTIKFDIDFPSLPSSLSSLVNSKLQVLKADPVAMNNQVVGLLVFNQFLPTQSRTGTITGDNGSRVASGVGSMLGDLVSAQLSSYVSSIMENVLSENGILDDMDISVRLDDDLAYGVTLNPKFKNFDIVLGADYLTQSLENNYPTGYAQGDFILDYYLTDDRKIKIRIYAKTDRQIGTGRRQRAGTGLYYRKEFSSFKELRESFNIFAKKLKK